MSQIANPPAPSGNPPANPPAPNDPPLIAGKYKDQAAFETGIVEARKKLGLDLPGDGQAVIGENGLYNDVGHAERAYKDLDKLISKGAGKPPEPKPNPSSEPLKIGADAAPVDDNADIPTLIQAAGLDLKEVEKTYLESGDLTDDQKKAIRAKRPGLSNGDIKFIADGLAARAELGRQAIARAKSEAAEIMGGEAQLTAFLRDEVPKFITDPKVQAEITAKLNNPAHTAETVRYLKFRHAEYMGAGGSRPIVNGHGPAPTPTVKNFDEYKALERRAIAGDKSAIAQLTAIPDTTIRGFRGVV